MGCAGVIWPTVPQAAPHALPHDLPQLLVAMGYGPQGLASVPAPLMAWPVTLRRSA